MADRRGEKLVEGGGVPPHPPIPRRLVRALDRGEGTQERDRRLADQLVDGDERALPRPWPAPAELWPEGRGLPRRVVRLLLRDGRKRSIRHRDIRSFRALTRRSDSPF